jgi:general secretion pathway protein A
MYIQHFGLTELPFSIAPDPRYLFMSEQHREALAHLLYGMNTDGGFVMLTGEVGTGKTTVCRCFLEQVPDNVNIAIILNPKVTAEELLATICDELRIPYSAGCSSIKTFVDAINSFLLNAYSHGRKTVLLIDEAQNLKPDVLEQIRLLTNLETNQQKLLQIIMIGQPELRGMLSRPGMSQLSQRITARYHLGSLSKEDVAVYVNHRLFIAGAKQTIFPDSVISKLHRLSRGIPRLINIICDRALLGAYVQGKPSVDKKTLVRASEEVFGKSTSSQRFTLKSSIAVFMFIVCGTALAATLYYQKNPISFFERQGIHEKEAKNTSLQIADSLNWPSGDSLEGSKTSAYEALFREWGIPYPIQNPDSACTYVMSKGLHCLETNGDMKTLTTLNRPVVLKLSDNSARDFFALLKGLKDERAILFFGNETRTVDVSEIKKRWRGAYLLLWKTPKHYAGAIYPGHEGPIVRWLSRQLSVINGIPNNSNYANIYHDELVNQVKLFQSREGLEPDGVVGSQTFICILNKTGTSEPSLIK